MRDINRLDTFYENLKEIHKINIPDWRFGQFMLNFMSWFYTKYKNDIFYVEESRMIGLFNKYFKEMGH